MKDAFGDRMKAYESENAKKKFDGRLPLYMRIDGRGFSKVSKKLKLAKPRDGRMIETFVDATTATMKEFHLQFGFCQSDEVSLFFPILENEISNLPFDGKIQKLNSVIPSFFTANWIIAFRNHFNQELDFPVAFDARLVEFPSKAEAVNMLIWRWKDAERNFVSDQALTMYSAKALHGISHAERVEMIGEYDPDQVGQFIRPVKIAHKGTEGQDVLRNKYFGVTPDKGFKNCTFDEKVEFVYGEMSIKD